jgi:hypothetical protein
MNPRALATGIVLACTTCLSHGQSVKDVAEPFRKAVPPAKPYVAAPEAAASAPAVAEQPKQQWEVLSSDMTLSRTLQRWAETAGYRLKWDAERNFLISASHHFEGSFETALAAALATPGVARSDYPLEACIYSNTPPLVRVTRAGEQARECAAASK